MWRINIKRCVIIVISLLLLCCNAGDNSSKNTALPQPGDRPDNQTCIAPEQGPISSPTLNVVKAFPNLPDMGAVVAFKQAPGNPDRWFAVIQDGRILVFDNIESVSTTSEFLNIQSQVEYAGEQGLLGMAFHPDYNSNGEIYLYYSTLTPDRRSNISRFTLNNNNWQEDIILSVKQPFGNHNGGNLLFGPDDGYLYIGLGDGGSGFDPQDHGQNPRTLLGSMLRIDVDAASSYAIPPSNPYFGNTLCSDPNLIINAQSCPEIYAYGLRNPWRWSFDRVTGDLWLGDVGQNRIEEIDIIESGGNYGWVVMEGSECVDQSTTCNTNNDYILPVAEYSHDGGGRSVVGGYVYRGNDNALSFLYGTYLFADTITGEIWGTDEINGVFQTTRLLDSNLTIYSFAESLQGDIYVLAYANSGMGNNIYKIETAIDPVPVSTIPPLLSGTGCFESTNPLVPATGVIPYTILSPLWSDGAGKQRYFAIPNNSHVDVNDYGDLIFPVGSVLIKSFYLDSKPVETRLLMRHNNGWGGYSYEWQYDNLGNPVDAQLLDASLTKNIAGHNWLYPDRLQCFECHTQVTNVALGPETRQLNTSYTNIVTNEPENQLSNYETFGIFSSSLDNLLKITTYYSLDDNNTSYELRAKSYLHANCAHCHQPGGPTPSAMDLRFTTPLSAMNICDVDPLQGDLGVSGIKLVDPQGTFSQPNSVIVARMESLDESIRMPPLATDLVDDQALVVIKNWIDSLTRCN